MTLSPNGSATFQRSVHELFNLGFPKGSELVTGSIQIEATGGGIVGDVLFGDPGDVDTVTPNKIDFGAALPVQTKPFRKAIFSHVVNGATDPNDPSTDAFTGIAIFNPNTVTANVTVRVFDREGSLVGEASLQLRPRARLSKLVEEMVPSSSDLIGGYIVLESDQPVVAQELFGNSTLEFLSAVPPRIIE